jgi:hypothetical protein
MTKGIIYLIQPAELVGTNRFKIGCSTKTDLDRCKNGYKIGSRYLCIAECNNPFLLEHKIKNVFNNNFKLIAGNEYYEGNENDIFELFVGTMIKHKNEEDENTEESDEIDYSNKIYKITTLDDYLKISDINEIIITNTKTKTGYLKFNKNNKKTNKWYEIFKTGADENLLGWLKEYSKTHDHEYDYQYDYNKIIKDICNKCYKIIKPFEIQYHQYFVTITGDTNNELESIIINTKDLSITYYNSDSYDTILTEYDSNYCHSLFCFSSIKTDIVDDILNELIKDKNVLKQYKKLCYNVLVEPKEQIIFYDYSYKDFLLSMWLNDALSHLYNKHYFKHYYDVSTNNKDIKKYKPRIVCINYNDMDEKQLTGIIDNIQKIGIKNIIIRSSDKNLYNYHSNNQNYDYDLIFSKKDLFFYNFLKWCCVQNISHL